MIRVRTYLFHSSSWPTIDIALANGQSNSIGGGAEQVVLNPSPLSPTTFMLSPGGIANPRSQSAAYDWVANTTGIAPQFEILWPAGTQSETGWTRMSYEIQEQAAAAGSEVTWLGATGVGSGGLTIEELSTSPPGAGPGDGGPSNSRISLIACVRVWLAQCVANRRRPTFWMPWLQGEASYTQSAAAYATDLINYRNLMDADLLPLIREVNPDHGPIQMIVGQLGVRGVDGFPTQVGEGQLQAALDDPNIWCFATHNIPKVDNYHHSAAGRQFLAGQFAKAYRELKLSGQLRMLRPVRCVTTDWVNFDVSVTDHPTSDDVLQVTDGPLLLDDPYVAAITGAGFLTSDGIGRAATASVLDATTVRVTFSTPPPLGSAMMYALSVAGDNQISNSTGNVTDSRPGVSTYDASWNLRRPMLSRRVPIILDHDDEDPGALSGLYGWYRADTGLTDGGGGRATAWTAKQGSGSFAFGTAGKEPLISPGAALNQQGLYFSLARQDFGTWTGSFPTGAFSVAAIIREEANSGVGNNHIFSGPSTGAGRRHLLFDATTFGSVMEDTAGLISRSAVKPVTYIKGETVSLFVQSFDNAAARRLFNSLQGAPFVASVSALTGTWTPNNTICIGSVGGATVGNLDATIFDLFIFSRTLYGTADDALALQTLINYAVHRYGATVIPIASTSPGNKGMTVNDSSYSYVAVANDSWRRSPTEVF